MYGKICFQTKSEDKSLMKAGYLIDKIRIKYCPELPHCFSDGRVILDSMVKHSEQNSIENIQPIRGDKNGKFLTRKAVFKNIEQIVVYNIHFIHFIFFV